MVSCLHSWHIQKMRIDQTQEESLLLDGLATPKMVINRHKRRIFFFVDDIVLADVTVSSVSEDGIVVDTEVRCSGQ